MQTFHNRLFSSKKADDPHLANLTRVTEAGLEQMTTLRGAPAWNEWPSLSK